MVALIYLSRIAAAVIKQGFCEDSSKHQFRKSLAH